MPLSAFYSFDPYGAPVMPQNPSQDRPGRLRAAWLVLRGQRVVPQQIVAEWAEYQQVFDDILSRWSASLARQAKARKAEMERLDRAAHGSDQQTEMQLPATARREARKADLRHRAAARGLSLATGSGGPLPMPSAIPDPNGDDDG